MEIKPFDIEINIISEIRHGSPYNVAELKIIGKPGFKIKRNNDWQNIQAWTDDNKYLALIKWDITLNEPGFRIALFDSMKGLLKKTDRIPGCCNTIKLNAELNIECEIFTLISKPNEEKEYGIIFRNFRIGV